jgi:hypothetical protein
MLSGRGSYNSEKRTSMLVRFFVALVDLLRNRLGHADQVLHCRAGRAELIHYIPFHPGQREFGFLIPLAVASFQVPPTSAAGWPLISTS